MNGSEILMSKLEGWSDVKGQSLAIIETSTDSSITYTDFFTSVTNLHQHLGSKPLTILTTLPGSIADSILWFTSLIYGHLLIPMPPSFTKYEFHDLVKKLHVDVVVTDSEELQVVTHNSLSSKELLSFSNSSDREQAEPIDGSVLFYSSGSTGEPKGMKLSATNIIHTAQNIAKSHELDERDRGLTPLPFYHVNAPIVSLITTIYSGGTLIVAPKFSASQFWSWVEKYDPTWISLVPTIITILLKGEKPTSLHELSLRFVRSASAPLPAITLKKFEEKFSVPVVETYGISEAGSTITANPVEPGKQKPGSVGFPIGVDLCIADTEIKNTIVKLDLNDIGEICVKGPNVIERYEDDVSKDAFIDGWFRTGDMGYIDDEGYIHITGRIKDVINRGGEIISPREIEDVILTYPGISEAVVVGQPDKILGEKVVAYLTLTNKKSLSLHKEDVFEYLTQKLSKQKVPSEIVIIDEMPKGRTGKIDKIKLRSDF